MQTTIDIPAPLGRKIERAAESNGTTVSQVIVATLRAQFGDDASQAPPRRVSLPLIQRDGAKGVDLSREQIDDAMFG